MDKKTFISYLNDNDSVVSGFFELIEQSQVYVKFKTTNGNIVTLPYHRILKIKENEK